MTIMDSVNTIAEREWIKPQTGTIADCINNIVKGKGGTPVGNTIADAIEAYANTIPDQANNES